jgi:hypothetical protein
MNEVLNQLERVSKNVIMWLFILMVAFLAVTSVFLTIVDYELETITRQVDWFWLNLAVMALLVLAGAYVKLNREKLRWLGALATGKFIVVWTILNSAALLGWILVTQLEPVVDQMLILQVVERMLKSDYSDWLPGFNYYMFDYPYQNGIVLFYYYIAKITGSINYMLYQVINVPFFLLGTFAVYRVCRRLWKNKNVANGLVYLVMPLWVPFALYVTFIYGTIVGFAFAMLGIMFMYDYFEQGKWYQALLSAVSMGLGVVLKSNYAIFLVALVIMVLLDWIDTRRHRDVVAALLLVVVYVAMKNGVNLWTEHITGIATPSGIPKTAWIRMGIGGNDTYGWWDGYTLYVYNSNGWDYDAANAEAISAIVVRLEDFVSNPLFMCKFYFIKICSIWINPLFQGITIQNDRESAIMLSGWVSSLIDTRGILYMILLHVMDVVQSLVYVGALCFMWLRRKTVSTQQLIWAVLFIGGFLFELMWESKCQYTIFFFYLLIPYAIYGWNDVIDRVAVLIGRKEKRDGKLS